MVYYECYYCLYNTTDKTRITKHLDRKTKCNNIKHNNLSLNSCKESILNGILYIDYLKSISINIDDIDDIDDIDNIDNINNINNINNNKLICNNCDKVYKSKKTLNTHKVLCIENNTGLVLKLETLTDKYNKKLKDLKLKMNLIKELETKNKELNKLNKLKDRQINKLINTNNITNNITNNNNIVNNINVLNFSETDLTGITEKILRYCIGNYTRNCVPKLIQYIHFNDDKPENHNIYISNINNNYIMIRENDKWICKNRDSEIFNLIIKYEDLLNEELDNLKESGIKCSSLQKLYDNYLEKTNDTSTTNIHLNYVKKELELTLYNNRNMIK